MTVLSGEPASRCHIRPARAEDGPAIGKLYQDEPQAPQADWERPGTASWWIVAEADDGAIVGAMQVTASLPAAYIGDVIVTPGARRLGIARALLEAAEGGLRRAGCQWVGATLRGTPWWVETVITTAGFTASPEPAVFVRKELLR